MIFRLVHFNIRSELTEAGQDVVKKLEQTDPSVILIESSSANGLHARVDKMVRIMRQLTQPTVLVVVSVDDTMDSRLNAVRSGASAYFLSPVKIVELVDFIRLQQLNKDITAYRILIVDDDGQQADHTALILMQAGMETCVVTQPMKALETLTNFQPELILMDLHMPECNGLELAAVIRQYCNFTGIGIVFFSMDSDIDRHIDALRAGGDEFLVKSLSPVRLLANVEARVKRARLIQRLMLRDGLTGLLNRSSIDEHLQLEINKIKRLSGCFAYVILDLDRFKQINDRYGHLAGDEVLRSLGLFLLQRLRAIDLIGRYGGEEIVILLPGTDAKQAKTLVNKLLQTFSALKFTSKGSEFFVTFSAGIAEFPYFNNISALIEAADQALYLAKAEGRNRVCVAALDKC